MAAIANEPYTLSIVERYLGATPTILGYTAWWSFAQPDEARDAQLFHQDMDDYRFVKMFIYLSDVGPRTDPIPTSNAATTRLTCAPCAIDGPRARMSS